MKGRHVSVEPNGDPECVEMIGEPVPVDGDGDTLETDRDPVGTNGECKPEPVCTGVRRGG